MRNTAANRKSHEIIFRQMLWYTLGPATLGKELAMLAAGANGVRLTFSYGNSATQLQRAKTIKKSARLAGRDCLVVADLAGAKVRLGDFQSGATIEARAGASVVLLATESANPTADDLTLPVPNLALLSQLKEGDEIIVGEGSAEFVITAVNEKKVTGKVSEQGIIGQRRGLTVRKSGFQPRCLTPKDLRDLDHVLSQPEYDCLALSFVASVDDVLEVKKAMTRAGRTIPVVAKIESVTGIKNIESICKVADCVMAARGDLGLAVPWFELPEAVERIAAAANKIGTPWILATQIAEGLDKFATLSRAEICDLSRWLREGACGILLSHETAFGTRPLTAVKSTSQMLAKWGRH